MRRNLQGVYNERLSATIPEIIDLYDDLLSPMISRLIKLCRKHGIPVLVHFQVGYDEEKGPFYCSTSHPFDRQGERMKEINGLFVRRRSP